MHLPDLGSKEILDWTVPIALTWIGSGVRKYMKSMRDEICQAKDSVIKLNVKIAQLLERVDSHGRELDGHEKRLQHVEQKIPRTK